jgi:molecular chaperone GrpE
MECVGQDFDPNFHEAIMQEPSTDHEEGIIMEELRPGYLVKDDRVLRHSLVKVSSGKIDGDRTGSADNSAENATSEPS